jgi:hypothetical protein
MLISARCAPVSCTAPPVRRSPAHAAPIKRSIHCSSTETASPPSTLSSLPFGAFSGRQRDRVGEQTSSIPAQGLLGLSPLSPNQENPSPSLAALPPRQKNRRLLLWQRFLATRLWRKNGKTPRLGGSGSGLGVGLGVFPSDTTLDTTRHIASSSRTPPFSMLDSSSCAPRGPHTARRAHVARKSASHPRAAQCYSAMRAAVLPLRRPRCLPGFPIERWENIATRGFGLHAWALRSHRQSQPRKLLALSLSCSRLPPRQKRLESFS